MLWPELTVLLLFLAADLIWSGMAAAAAGVAAGVASFTALFISGRKKPSLLIEGLIFGGVSALGELIAFPGGNLILMEIVLGTILLVSIPFGWNLMGRMAGDLGRGFFSNARSNVLAAAMGFVFTLHGGLFVLLSLNGAGSLLAGAVLFAALYAAALRFSSKRMREAARSEFPELIEAGDGRTAVREGGETLGRFSHDPGPAGILRITGLEADVPLHRFLSAMEKALAAAGHSAVLITGWEGDGLELEMNGFVEYEGGWRKGLRGIRVS